MTMTCESTLQIILFAKETTEKNKTKEKRKKKPERHKWLTMSMPIYVCSRAAVESCSINMQNKHYAVVVVLPTSFVDHGRFQLENFWSASGGLAQKARAMIMYRPKS
jgi:hypothetical protein